MKKKIIVPVDFSAASHNAYLYARDLANTHGASLEVVHFYTDWEIDNREKRKKRAEELEDQLANFVAVYPVEETGALLTKTKVNLRLKRGKPIPSIVKTSQQKNTVFIVMGSTGSHDKINQLFGSVSSNVAQQAHCPVLLIPKGVKYADYEHILYASNFESAAPLMIQQIIDFANVFRSTIHFIHIREAGETEDFTMTEERIFQQLFKEGDPAFSFNMAVVESESVAEGINQYAAENQIDLITLVNIKRGFFDTLFGKSLTKAMALKTHLPLMVFHLPKVPISQQ